jgi:hypothetical protein
VLLKALSARLPTRLAHVPCFDRRPLLAIAGQRAVWRLFNRYSSPQEGVVATGSVGQAPRRLQEIFRPDETVFPVGDEDLLAYGHTRIEEADCSEDLTSCTYTVTSGGVNRIVAARRRRIPTAPPPAAIALSAGRVAIAPAASSRTGILLFKPKAVLNGPVHIRNARDGSAIATFAPSGYVEVVALSGQRAALLVREVDASRQIEIWDTSTGTFLRGVPVPSDVASELDMSRQVVVYRIGREIHRLDTETGGDAVVWVAPVAPIGLSIEGRRVAWAETLRVAARRVGRIRAVTLGR